MDRNSPFPFIDKVHPVLRWVALGPVALLGSLAALFFMRLATRFGMLWAVYEYSILFRIAVEGVSSAAFGYSMVFLGVLMAPKGKKAVAYIIFAVLLFISLTAPWLAYQQGSSDLSAFDPTILVSSAAIMSAAFFGVRDATAGSI